MKGRSLKEVQEIAVFVRREALEHRTRSQREYDAQALELNAQRISSVAGVLLRTLNVVEREVRDDNARIAAIAESGSKWKDEFRPHQIRIEQWRETAKLALQDEAPNTAIGDFVVMKYPKETERAYRYEIERFSLCRERLNDVILDPHRWAKENRARTRGAKTQA